MGVPVQSFLKERRNRALGSILGFAEREIFPQLNPQQRHDLRETVLNALNSYHDTVLDLVKAEDSVRNDAVIEALERLDRRVTSALKQPASTV